MRTASRSRQRPSTGDAVTARLHLLLGSTDPSRSSSEDDEWSADPDVSTVDDPPVADGPALVARRPGAAAARWSKVVERWSPVGLRGARTDPGRRGAAVLILVGLLAALGVGILLWRDRPRPEPVGAPTIVSGTAPDMSAGPAAPPASELVVAVTGRVRKPGVVTVPAGARVIDALQAAGGPLPGADLILLNLARKVADGELILVGLPGAAPVPGSGPGAGAPVGHGAPAGGSVDLNAATLADLDILPGVGPVLAQRILDWRTEHGRFDSVDQLGEVPGIGETRLAQLRDLVRV